MILNNKKKIHFVGIGGAGMSGLADILLEMGFQVSGSDREGSETTDYLQSRGALIFEGHKSENVTDADLVVFSSAVPTNNPELVQAEDLNVPCIKRAEMLGELIKEKEGIAVAGTHGKTTTTSMIGHMLTFCGLDPTVVVGGKMQNSKTNAQLGRSKYFVTEADEYDRSFLTLFPKFSVLNNLEEDHLDIYKDLKDLKDTFLKYANQTKMGGKLIVNSDSKNISDLVKYYKGEVLSFAIKNDADIKAENIRYDDGTTYFDVIVNDTPSGTVKLNMPGQHNIYNALATLTIGTQINLSVNQMQQAIEKFMGVHRRFEFKGNVNEILFFDDYAHHPTEVYETIKAAKTGWQRRVVVIFQPHLYSRTRDFYKDFASALSNADKAIITPVYPAREKALAGVTSDLIAKEMGDNCISIKNNGMIDKAILKTIQPNDLVLTMGAGDIWIYGEKAIEKLRLLN